MPGKEIKPGKPGEPGEKHIIIGTAGHVDHGKTQLVKRLTGVDTDRLKEEKERGISIELGFAPLDLPSGLRAGLVDVPGHERFVKHMLAGAAGIDLVLLVVAADEGVMPQTREHLDIIQLLGIKKGIVVLTKKDLAEEDLLLLVEEEVRELTAGTSLADAPLVAVSSVTGEGIEELLALIDRMVQEVPEKEAAGRARLPIDRVFTIAGFGTVVTGTLFSGRIRVGDTLEVLPLRREVRVRNLQVHGVKVEEAWAGQRVAVNLSGVATQEIERGSVLAAPGYLTPSFRLDVQLRLLPHLDKGIKNWARVRFHLGTKEALGRVLLLETEELLPGEAAYAQMVMEEPVVAAARDRFVLRAYSPMYTIGGGEVIDPAAPKRRRFRSAEIEQLATRQKGSPQEVVLQVLASSAVPLAAGELEKKSGLLAEEAAAALESLQQEGKVTVLPVEGTPHFVHSSVYAEWQSDLGEALLRFHQQYPLRPGASKEEIRSRHFAFLPAKVFNALLQSWEERGVISVRGQSVAVAGHKPALSPEQEKMAELIRQRFREGGIQPPDAAALRSETGLKPEEMEELLGFCLQQGWLAKIGEGFYFDRETVEKAREALTAYLQEHGAVSVAEARDLLGGSRKYILPLLEYFDREKVTRRVGDKRVLYR